MKNAREMYEISKSNSDNIMEKELDYIQQCIEEAAKDGHFAIKFMRDDYPIDYDLEQELTKHGYEVSRFSDQREPHESSTTISWSEIQDSHTNSNRRYSNASQFVNYEQTR